MRKIIYTAIINDYDVLTCPKVTEGWEYICYTNNPDLKSDVWKIIQVNYNDQRGARKLKILPPFFNEYWTECLWVDGNIHVHCNLDSFVKLYCKEEISVMKHYARDCIYQEANECIRQGKDNPVTISNHIFRYQMEDYPSNNGMVASRVLYRINSEKVKDFSRKWWHELEIGSVRDQLSFNYVAYKMETNIGLFPHNLIGKLFTKNKHKN